MRFLILILVHVLAAWVPLASRPTQAQPDPQEFAAWPDRIGGVELTRIALSEQERGFYEDFPGKIARFLAGDREVVIRYVSQPSRKLHPAADCLRGSGYRVSPQPAQRDGEGGLWGCMVAEKEDRRLRICEQLKDARGGRWYDVSSWYWAASLGWTSGPWWAVTVAERI